MNVHVHVNVVVVAVMEVVVVNKLKIGKSCSISHLGNVEFGV